MTNSTTPITLWRVGQTKNPKAWGPFRPQKDRDTGCGVYRVTGEWVCDWTGKRWT